jgi:hypothetical protein
MHFLRAFGQLAPAESFDAINSTLFSDTPKIDPFTALPGACWKLMRYRGLAPGATTDDKSLFGVRRKSNVFSD